MHTPCFIESELPLAFTVAPCNENDKCFFGALLERMHAFGASIKKVLADTQYSPERIMETAREYDAEPVIPVRRDSRVREALRAGKNFVVHGALRLMELSNRR